MAVSFDAATVMAMLALVEGTTVAGLLWASRSLATQADVDEVETTARDAAQQAALARQTAEQASDRLDSLTET